VGGGGGTSSLPLLAAEYKLSISQM
jgi:hypothetical protein